MSREVDASTLPSDWAEALMRHGFDSDAVDQLVTEIYDSGPAVFPPKEQVFRAFHLTPLNDVRVVILGQDPYPRKGQANGLAFSFDGERLPRSLRAIYANLEDDEDVAFHRPSDGDLTAWANQGVLLLNTALTVEDGGAGSHVRRWRDFIDHVLHVINEECGHVAFLLWGSEAIKKAKSIHQPRHEVLRASHPMPRGTSKEKSFNESHTFSGANRFLKGKGLPEIDWSLVRTP